MRGNVYFLERGNDRYNLSDKFRLTNRGNFGLSAVEYITQANSQVGERVISYRLPPRLIQLTLYAKAVFDMSQWWANRAELIELLSPARTEQLSLVAHLSNGSRRAIDLKYESGAEFPGADASALSSKHLELPLTLIAHNPLWYDSFDTELTFAVSGGVDLFFPFDFPKLFDGEGSYFESADLAYNGNTLFRTYPTITLTGPFESVRLVNTATNARVRLVGSVATGESRVINLGETERSIVDGNGDNRFYELSDDSDITNFYIVPNPGGVQKISVNFTGDDGNTDVSLSYNARYLGI